MKAKISSRITINARPAEIFKYLKHTKYHYLWNPQIRTIEPETTLKLGSKYKTTSVILGKQLSAENNVTKFEDNRELELENTTGLVHYCARFTLRSKGNKTLVVCETSVDSRSKAF